MSTNNPDEHFFQHLSELYGPDTATFIFSKGELCQNLQSAKDYFQRLQALKKYYSANDSRIKASFEKSKILWASTYPTDWSKLHTPIEQEAWMSIRAKGNIVLYPQFPVLNYFIDFANPGLKVGLELDGKDFHNSTKDKIRDDILRDNGWTIYRIKGSEMMNTNYEELFQIEENYRDYEETDEEAIYKISKWLLETGDGVIEAIKHIHFKSYPFTICNEDVTAQFDFLCHKTLQMHQNK